jgi:dGTPase
LVATEEELRALDVELGPFRSARLAGPGPDDVATRTGAQRDADRILYARAFQRLGGVTQVVAVNETQLFHNRLTHSLKVAQIGQRLTQRLRERTEVDRLRLAGGLDPDVVYAAALAHDLGHPPFGHIAEDELQAVLEGKRDAADNCAVDEAAGKLDSFEGNAQSFRIVTKLAWRVDAPDDKGLNLTRATLAAILKYPWKQGEGPPDKKRKWGAYRSEGAAFAFATATPDGQRHGEGWRSPEAVIMDWADDIAYAVHDVEDFFRAGLIPMDRLARQDDREAQRFISRASAEINGKDGLTAAGAEEAFHTLRSQFLRRQPYDGSQEDQVALGRLASALITRFAAAVRVSASGEILIASGARHEAEVLKKLTWFYMIDTPGLFSLQAGQRDQVRSLYRRLVAWADAVVTKDSQIKIGERQLPKQLAELLTAVRADDEAVDAYGEDAPLRRRAVVDYLVGLTEPQTAELAERVQANGPRSAVARWLQA